ncbi:hypothetical protein DM02DRAFT_659463 [Periconia macrospinosa]|uniref:Mid2 domain-containing protein n=1 Tax=Periconia macrospinosa TaxID=97972 RepID=A0A2V1DDR1_9PLEO|nr:hypothetical protein DM02DRAFT_659463 [Periconia macrospinosa]
MLPLITAVAKQPTSATTSYQRPSASPTFKRAASQQYRSSADLAKATLKLSFVMAPKVQFHPLTFANRSLSSQPPPTVTSPAKPNSTTPSFLFTPSLRVLLPDHASLISSKTTTAKFSIDPSPSAPRATPSSPCQFILGDHWQPCSIITVPTTTRTPVVVSSRTLPAPTATDTLILIPTTTTTSASTIPLAETSSSFTQTEESSSYTTAITEPSSDSPIATECSFTCPSRPIDEQDLKDVAHYTTASRAAIGAGVGVTILFLAVVSFWFCVCWARRKTRAVGAPDVEARKAWGAAGGAGGQNVMISAPYGVRKVEPAIPSARPRPRLYDEISLSTISEAPSSLPPLPPSVESVAQSFTIPRKPLPSNSQVTLNSSLLDLIRLDSSHGEDKVQGVRDSGSISSGSMHLDDQEQGDEDKAEQAEDGGMKEDDDLEQADSLEKDVVGGEDDGTSTVSARDA